MNRITHQCQQGSNEWLKLRAHYFTASEASAMMGASKYQSRQSLLRAKATGIVKEVDAGKQCLFDAGHQAEASARPFVEARLGEELYNVTMSVVVDGLPLLASLDGITMMGDVIWENKLLNASLKAAVENDQLDPHYALQLEQQLLVSGAEKAYFTTSDGTEESTFGMWYESDPELRMKLVAGWKQFAEDLANYQPEVIEAKPILTANPLDHLPALIIEVTGAVTYSNLVQFKAAATDVISSIKTELVSDQDFVDATSAVKYLKDVEDNAKRAKQNALDQTTSIAELHRALDEVAKMAGDVRKALDKKITEEKDRRKAEIVLAASQALFEHLQALRQRVGGFMPTIDGGFAEAIKGLKSLDSMRDKVSAALANAKIEANAIADRIDANRKTVEDMSLVPDFNQVCTKAPDDFAALLAMRSSARKEAEAKRLEAEREKIRAEEQAKAQREAAEKAAAEKREAEAKAAAAQAEANRIAAEEIRKLDAERKAAEVITEPASTPAPAPVIEQVATPDTQPANDDGSMIKLGEICARLGFTVTADFLTSLGFEVVATDKNAKLYKASSFPAICGRISDHVLRLAFKKAA